MLAGLIDLDILDRTDLDLAVVVGVRDHVGLGRFAVFVAVGDARARHTGTMP